MKHHLNLREHQCDHCNKAFNEKNDLTKHIKRVHIADRPAICDICEKAFKDTVQLRRHYEGHSDRKAHLCTVSHITLCYFLGYKQLNKR